MPTIMASPPTEGTVPNMRLVTRAINVVHPNGARSSTEMRVFMWLKGVRVTQLSAHHVCIRICPDIATDCPPLATMIDLHSSFVGARSINQSNGNVCMGIYGQQIKIVLDPE